MTDPVSIASGIAGLITLALQVTNEVYGYVKSISERERTAKDLASELELLGTVLSQLRDFLLEEHAKGSAFDQDSVLERAIKDCKQRIERIGDKIKPKDGNKLARILDSLIWPFRQEQVLQMMENLRRFRSTFEFALSIKGCRLMSRTSDQAQEGLQQMLDLSKKTEEMLLEQGIATDALVKQNAMLQSVNFVLSDLQQTAEDVRDISHSVRLAEEREQQRQVTDILNWLVSVNDLHKHRDVQAKWSQGTGEWFVESDEFTSWLKGDQYHDFLCMGMPGVGKSVLCSLVIDRLRKMHQTSDTAVIYYYFDYAEQQAQTPEHLARCILRQACSSYSLMPAAVTEFWKKTKDVSRDGTWFQSLLQVLHRVISTFSKCYIVIDALDETENIDQRSSMLRVLDGIRTASPGTKVFATTRPHLSDIAEKFHRPLTMHVTARDSDLKRYVTGMLTGNQEADDILDDKLKREIVDKLCEHANGMFLLPALHVREILDQPTRADIRKSLSNLSADLTSVFSSTLDRIQNLSSKRKAAAFNTLMWLSHAKRSLRVDELQHALAVDYGEDDINKDNFMTQKTITTCCCGLVEVDKDSNTIRLVHFSLEEYLRTQEHNLFRDADLTITRSALKYMTYTSLRPISSLNRSAFERTLTKVIPFADYACMHWGEHAQSLDVHQYQDVLMPLFNDPLALLAIARIRDAKSPDFRQWAARMQSWAFSADGGAAISIAAGFGLTSLLRFVLSQHKEPNLHARNMYGSTPLHEAAIHGHVEVAEVLIAHGADILDTNRGKATSFFLAVSYGRLAMVRTLLKYGRDQLDVHCKSGFTALHRAAELGIPSLVEYLLSEGALIAAHDDRGSTPLHHACLRGHLEVAQMLILGGALVDIEAKNGLTALDEAATAGHRPIAELLLTNGANVRHRAADNWTPLHRAARGAHTDTVVLLLSRGASPLDQDLKCNIPLHHAARAGSLETCAQLLDYDAAFSKSQLSATDRRGATAREIAFFTAHYRVSKYLRAAEHRIFNTEPTASSKMTLAIENGDLTQVQDLLSQNPAAIELLDQDGQPPLHVALQEHQHAIATHLLERGAPIDQAGYHGWRALHIASSLGSLPSVQLCLTHNANIHALTSTHQTSLHKAASSGSIPVIRHLISAGVDINARNDRGMTCLHIAAHKNDEGVVRMLVGEYGMDVTVRDRYGQTPALWAEKGAGLSVGGYLRGLERRVRGSRGMGRNGSEGWEGSRDGKEAWVGGPGSEVLEGDVDRVGINARTVRGARRSSSRLSREDEDEDVLEDGVDSRDTWEALVRTAELA